MKKLISTILVCVMLLGVLASCNTTKTEGTTDLATSAPTEQTTEEKTEVKTEDTSSQETSVESTSEETSAESGKETSEETSEETSTEEITTMEERFEIDGLDIKAEDLQDVMKDILHSGEMRNETVFLLDTDLGGEPKSLLFPVKEIVSITNYAGTKALVEGVDYTLTDDGKIQFLSTSTFRAMKESKYYGTSDSTLITTKPDGTTSKTHWGEGTTMTSAQVCVTYKYDADWTGFAQKSNLATYENVVKKLIAGEDVTFIFYGDSITCGANSSWFTGIAPYQYSYSMLFTEAIADIFDYTVNYVNLSHLHGLIKKTPENYVAGDRGTINFLNPSVGGWKTSDGVNNFDTFVKPYIEQYGCDLLCVAFGMNDGGTAVDAMVNSTKQIIDKASALSSDLHVTIMSTMVPNNIATNGWYGNQDKQEAELIKLAATLTESGINTAVTQMTSMSLSVLEYKNFVDYTGNNINHPNDFFGAIYAQTLFQSFIGYEYLT